MKLNNMKLRLLVVNELFSGYKTYITGGLMVVLGLMQSDTQMVGTGLGLIFLRNGIAKG